MLGALIFDHTFYDHDIGTAPLQVIEDMYQVMIPKKKQSAEKHSLIIYLFTKVINTKHQCKYARMSTIAKFHLLSNMIVYRTVH